MKTRLFIAVLVLHCFSAIAFSQIAITEIMYRPASLQVEHEFVEIYNASPNEVDLSYWQFSKGVSYTFPPGAVLQAGQYAVIGASPDALSILYPGLEAYGPYEGRLSNDGERVELVDASGMPIDSVFYLDELGWPTEADGLGPSIERVHGEMSSNYPFSWAQGPHGGTPGRVNDSAIPNPIPIISDVHQQPVVPRSTDPVLLTCQIHHPYAVPSAELYYKAETESFFRSTELFDDGLHDDQAAQDGIYGGLIPAYPNRTVVEFYIEAIDGVSQDGYFPFAGKEQAAIYRVDDSEYPSELPLYRVFLRDEDEQILRTRGNGSNEELFATFIHDNDIYYNVGVRFRGKGSRNREPKSYRVDFSSTRYFGDVRKLNLNAIDPHRQFVGMQVLEALHLPTPETQFVSVLFNKVLIPRYIQMERTDKDMMQRVFGDESGNLYRGIEQANLDYRGEDFGPYRSNYEKITNELQDDYSDIVRLCAAFSNTSDEEFPVELSKHIHITQWLRWFAAKKILNDMEGGLSKERGDDYYMYHNPVDELFYLLPWDLDSVLVKPFRTIHQYDTPAVRRLVTHPDLARFYYAELVNMLETELPQSAMDAIIDRTAPVANEGVRNDLKQTSRELRSFILRAIPRSLSIQLTQDIDTTLIEDDEEWRFYRGRGFLSANWNQNGYDDSSWETGPGGFGYGDGDDRTVLEDMRNNYTTVFLRKSFEIADPSLISSLQLDVLFDDGFIFYVNGVEIVRANVSGEPNTATLSAGSHEAQVFESFPIANISSLLLPGINTFAAVGVNTSLSSSDMSLAIRVNAAMKDTNIKALSGTVDAVHTRWVRVNGEMADYVPWKAEWMYLIPQDNQQKVFVVEALAADMSVVDVSEVTLDSIITPPDDDDIVSNGTWSVDQSPVVLNEDIVVQQNESLLIEPGVTVQLASAVSIIVYGTITVAGEPENPVRFEPASGSSTWGGIAIADAMATVRFQHVEFLRSAPFNRSGTNYPAAINIRASTVEIEHCKFLDIHPGGEGAGVNASRSYVMIRDSLFEPMGDTLHFSSCYAVIENNLFHKTFGSHDPIDFDGQMGPPSIVRHNIFLGSDDDGIDTGGTSLLIEGNWIQDIADKGLSLEGTSDVTVINNVIARCDIGVAVTNGTQAELIHNTIVSCADPIHVYEKTANQGGGVADILNCVVWDSPRSITFDEKSVVSISHSNLTHLPSEFAQSNLSVEPGFKSLGNLEFQLLETSPLIDAGIETRVMEDIEGMRRPSGRAPDIGAYEFEQSTRILDWQVY